MGSVSPPSPCLTVRRWVPIPIYGVKQCKRFAVWETSTGLAQPKYRVVNWPSASSSRSFWVMHSRGEHIDFVMELYKSCLYRCAQVKWTGEVKGCMHDETLSRGRLLLFTTGYYLISSSTLARPIFLTLLFKRACNDYWFYCCLCLLYLVTHWPKIQTLFYQIRLPPEHREGVAESWETSGYKIFANTGEVVGFFKQTTWEVEILEGVGRANGHPCKSSGDVCLLCNSGSQSQPLLRLQLHRVVRCQLHQCHDSESKEVR